MVRKGGNGFGADEIRKRDLGQGSALLSRGPPCRVIGKEEDWERVATSEIEPASERTKNACLALSEGDLPALYRSADREAIRAQAAFLRLVALQLVALCMAAGAGMVTWRAGSKVDWAGVVGASSFLLAGVLRWASHGRQLERTWYHGRTIAESVKTLAWRYSVGGDPFRIDRLSPAEADTLFVQRLNDVVGGFRDLNLTLLPIPERPMQITEAMRAVRGSELSIRKRVYEEGRIRDQISWYTDRARSHDQKASRWYAIVLGLEAAALLAAILKATGWLRVDLSGLMATTAAAAAAWLQTRQHSSLARAYAIAAHELTTICSLIPPVSSEDDWAKFVDQAEEAISREHTLWRASRS